MAHHRHKRDTNARLAERTFGSAASSSATSSSATPRLPGKHSARHAAPRATRAIPGLGLIASPRVAVVAAPLAVVATLSAVSYGLVAVKEEPAATPPPDNGSALSAALGSRAPILSRSERRREAKAAEEVADDIISATDTLAEREAAAATRKAIAGADTKLWTTEVLNLWTGPGADAVKIGEIDVAEQVLVTGRTLDGREEVVIDGRSRWVTAGFLDEDKPEPTVAGVTAGIGGSCTNGSSVPSGVSPNIAKVHAAVCARFPSITAYGTFRGGGGDHPLGRAVDIMVSGSTGWAVAEYVRANYAAFGVSYIIYSQKIWSVERAGEGWRYMSDRGSATANHYDHVHVSTF